MPNSALQSSIVFGFPYYVPGGRLTLTSNTPVMTAEEADKTSIFYTPYVHDLLPLYDGSAWQTFSFTQMTLALDTSGHPSGNNYDVFAVNDNGTLRIASGPAWSSGTSRGTGAGTTELERKNGRLVNKNTINLRYGSTVISNVPANRALYLGTFRTSANGQTTWELGGNADGGDPGRLFLWNAYNRVRVGVMVGETTNTWTYTTVAWRSLNNSNNNRVSYVCGEAGELVEAKVLVFATNNNSYTAPVGVGVDSTSVNSALYASSGHSSSGGTSHASYSAGMLLGFHFLQALESAPTGVVGTTTYSGDAGVAVQVQSGMTFNGNF